MRTDPNAVVLVGVGTAHQRFDDPAEGVEAVELMGRATEAAVADAGVGALVDRVTWIGVPEGTWSYRDPGALLAARFSLERSRVHTVVADVGILQQDLITSAIRAVAGGAEVALVVGGEAKWRHLRGVITGTPADETGQDERTVPDQQLTPGSLAAVGVHDLEIVRNTVTPVAAYALIENAIGHALGRTLDEHRDAVAALWARFAAVARDNPEAWDRAGHDAAAIRDAGDGNRMISFPYTKRHSAQWNVDQAAALLLCTVTTAEALGIARDRWVFPHSAAVANHAVAVVERPAVHRCPGAELAGPRALDLAGITADELRPIDLYSCFPSAVELFADALGLPLDDPHRPLTVTGGLAFAGGPLNNYVLQALVALASQLRDDAGSFGLSSSVSGFLVKQGFGVWSTSPPAHGFRADDVTAAVAAVHGRRAVVADGTGEADIVSFTVDVAAGAPVRSVVVAELPGGDRTIAEAHDPAVADALLAADPVGTRVMIRDGGFVPD